MNIEEVNKAIDVELRPDIRDEAKRLVSLANTGQLIELMMYHKADKGNIFCLCLDSIKDGLVKEGKITNDDYPSFGLAFLND